MTTLSFILLTIPFVLPVAAFYSAGELIRRRRLRLDAPSHRILDDLRGLEEAFIAFLASSKASSRILKVLAERRMSIGFNALVAGVRGYKTSSNHSEIPVAAIRAVVRILMFARLIRMRAGRYAITDLGREVHRRMRLRPFAIVPEAAHVAERGNARWISGRERPALVSHSSRALCAPHDGGERVIRKDVVRTRLTDSTVLNRR